MRDPKAGPMEGGLGIKEKAMKNKNSTKKLKKDIPNISLRLSDSKQSEKFYLQVGMEPYGQLGTGERCKASGCGQPVYDTELGLCSYHRMKQAEDIFEDQLKARQHKAVIKQNKN